MLCQNGCMNFIGWGQGSFGIGRVRFHGAAQ